MQILLAEDRHAARTEEHVDRVKRGLNQRPKGGLPTRQGGDWIMGSPHHRQRSWVGLMRV